MVFRLATAMMGDDDGTGLCRKSGEWGDDGGDADTWVVGRWGDEVLTTCIYRAFYMYKNENI